MVSVPWSFVVTVVGFVTLVVTVVVTLVAVAMHTVWAWKNKPTMMWVLRMGHSYMSLLLISYSRIGWEF